MARVKGAVTTRARHKKVLKKFLKEQKDILEQNLIDLEWLTKLL